MAEQDPSNPGAGPSDPANMFSQLQEFLQNALTTSRLEMENMMNRNKAEMEAMINEKLKDKRPIIVEEETEGGHATPKNSPKSDRVSFTGFKKCGATEFEGKEDTIKAFDWIKNNEKVFRISDCRESEKVNYVTAMLTGQALHWWEGVYASMTEERQKGITWLEFKEMFEKKYCPVDRQERFALDFLSLKQNNMSVTDYLGEFLSKMRFAPEYVSTEEKKVKRFVDGLKMEIREFIAGHKFVSLEEASEHARRREDIIEIKNAETPPPPK